MLTNDRLAFSSYIFIHRMLMEHFAAMGVENSMQKE
jgi:hypothetical protein